MNKRLIARPLLLAAAISLLTACGGDSDPAASATYSGTLTDSPVAGIAYTTSSGLSGLTDASGHFNFHAGDTVTFRLGGLELGSLATTGTEETVTPIDLVNALPGLDAATRQNVVTNLLVLLQSVDADGDPSNGISVPAAVSTALTDAVAAQLETELAGAPSTFTSSSTLLTDLNAASGSGVAPVDATAALQHFRDEFLSRLKGVYSLQVGSNHVTFRFDGQGHYVHTEMGVDEYDESNHLVGTSGVEAGTIDWNPATGEVTLAGAPTIDTNLQWGLSDPLPTEHAYFSLDGDTLLVRIVDEDPDTPDGELRVPREAEPANSLLGSWFVDGLGPTATQIQFLADGHAIITVPAAASGCETPGVEVASYTVADGVLVFSNAIVDTNGCAGIHDGLASPGSQYYSTAFSFNPSGSVNLGGTNTLYRYNATLY